MMGPSPYGSKIAAGTGHKRSRPGPPDPASCRLHKAAVALFKGMAQEGAAPDHTTYSNIIRSYMQQALGRHRQPTSDRLSECALHQ